MRNYTGKIWISDIDVQGFCEYEIHLRYVLGIPDPGSAELDDGRGVHETLDIANQLTAQSAMRNRVTAGLKIPTTIEEIVSVTRSEGESFAVRDVKVEGERIRGRIDQVDFTPEKIYIIEDKSPSKNGKPFFSEIHQVQGYCLAFSEQHHELGLPLVAVIRNKYTSKDMWTKLFTQGDALEANEAINRIIGIIKGTWVPVPTTSLSKCSRCRWHFVCEKSQWHKREFEGE